MEAKAEAARAEKTEVALKEVVEVAVKVESKAEVVENRKSSV